MSVVVVAGGSGDLGSLIVEALLETGKHEVYVLSRIVRHPRILTARLILILATLFSHQPIIQSGCRP